MYFPVRCRSDSLSAMPYGCEYLFSQLRSTRPPARKTLLAGAIFLGLGVAGYWQLEQTSDLSEFTILLITVLLTAATVLLGSIIDRNKAARQWLWLLVPYGCCLLLYSTVIRSVDKLGRYPTRELTHQFGSYAIAFFAIVFVWILIVPVRGSHGAGSRLRTLQSAVTAAVALAQILFAFLFLHELRSATSIAQVRVAARMLSYTGLAVYLLLVLKALLRRRIADIGTLAD